MRFVPWFCKNSQKVFIYEKAFHITTDIFLPFVGVLKKYFLTLQRTFLKRISGCRKNISSLYNGQFGWICLAISKRFTNKFLPSRWSGLQRTLITGNLGCHVKNPPPLYNGHFLVKRLHHFEKNFVMIKTRPSILQRTSFAENLAVLLKISLHLITDIPRRKIKCAAKKVLHYTTRVFESKSRCAFKFSFHFTTDIFQSKSRCPIKISSAL
jgi:hypothetical protein